VADLKNMLFKKTNLVVGQSVLAETYYGEAKKVTIEEISPNGYLKVTVEDKEHWLPLTRVVDVFPVA